MIGSARIGVGVLAGTFALGCGAEALVVASKKFTESVILGEIAAATLRAQGIPAVHRRELGGTRILWNARRVSRVPRNHRPEDPGRPGAHRRRPCRPRARSPPRAWS